MERLAQPTDAKSSALAPPPATQSSAAFKRDLPGEQTVRERDADEADREALNEAAVLPGLDQLARQTVGTAARPAGVPMDVYRDTGVLIMQFDLPGVAPESIDLNIQQNVLTLHAERQPGYTADVEVLVTERSTGAYDRQIALGDNLDGERLTAQYDAGVLTLRIPVVEQAEQIDIGSSQ